MEISTVNVIETTGPEATDIIQLVAFPDNPDGNNKAESLFTQLILETYFNKDKENLTLIESEELYCFIDDGYCKINDGYVMIVHSSGGVVPFLHE